jgi:hypothetical protein
LALPDVPLAEVPLVDVPVVERAVVFAVFLNFAMALP